MSLLRSHFRESKKNPLFDLHRRVFTAEIFLLIIMVNLACGSKDLPTITRSAKSVAEETEAKKKRLFFEEYKKLVHPFVQEKCGSCHSTTSPMFANADPILSAQAAFQGKKIDFDQPENSRLVQRPLKDNHNCGTKDVCESIGLELKKKIETLVNLIGKSTEPLPNLTNEMSLKDAKFVNRVVATQGNIFIKAANLGVALVTEGDLSFVRPSTTATILTASVKKSGDYSIWAYLRRGDSGSLQLSGSYQEFNPEARQNGADSKNLSGNFSNLTNTQGKFQWVLLNRVQQPSGNVETFKIKQQELRLNMSGSAIDVAMILITDVDYRKIPGGHPEAGQDVLEFDLAPLKISGKLQIGAKIYDPNGSKSYVFSAPRYIGDGSVKFKGLKIAINGKWNPIHSLFNAIDVTVSDGQYLSSGAMVVTSTQTDTDRIAISFETISRP